MELEASPDLASEGTQPHFCHRLLAPVSPEHALNLPNMGGGVNYTLCFKECWWVFFSL